MGKCQHRYANSQRIYLSPVRALPLTSGFRVAVHGLAQRGVTNDGTIVHCKEGDRERRERATEGEEGEGERRPQAMPSKVTGFRVAPATPAPRGRLPRSWGRLMTPRYAPVARAHSIQPFLSARMSDNSRENRRPDQERSSKMTGRPSRHDCVAASASSSAFSPSSRLVRIGVPLTSASRKCAISLAYAKR